MLQSEIPNNLLSLVYGAATDRSIWQELCNALSAFNGAPIMMFGHDTSADKSLGIIGGGLDPFELGRYHENFARHNPWMHMNLALPVGKVGVSDSALPRRNLFKTAFYNDWLRHQENIVAGPAMICHRSATKLVAIAGPCTERTVDTKLPQTIALFNALAPHLIKSIDISSTLSDGQKVSFSHLDLCPNAIAIVQRSGRVGFLNQAAAQFLSKTSRLQVDRADKLYAADEKIAAYLKQSISAMQNRKFGAVPNPLSFNTEEFGTSVMHSHIFPDDREIGFPIAAWSDPVVGVVVITGKFGIDGIDDLSIIAKSLGATPAEARLAKGVVGGLSLYDYADLNGLSRHTVRNQMRSLLFKSGTRNQVEFVSKVMSLTSPFSSLH